MHPVRKNDRPVGAHIEVEAEVRNTQHAPS